MQFRIDKEISRYMNHAWYGNLNNATLGIWFCFRVNFPIMISIVRMIFVIKVLSLLINDIGYYVRQNIYFYMMPVIYAHMNN